MRVVVARSGGVTGIAVRWVVDLGDGPEYSDWVVLIDACPWDDEEDDPPAPDRFVYLIRANGRRATLPEQRVQGPWRELVDRVRAAGTVERGRGLEPLEGLDPAEPDERDERGDEPGQDTPQGT